MELTKICKNWAQQVMDICGNDVAHVEFKTF